MLGVLQCKKRVSTRAPSAKTRDCNEVGMVRYTQPCWDDVVSAVPLSTAIRGFARTRVSGVESERKVLIG